MLLFQDIVDQTVNVDTTRGRSDKTVETIPRRDIVVCCIQEHRSLGKDSVYKFLWVGNS